MKRHSAVIILTSIFVFFFSFVSSGQAALPQGMTQGQFAIWLVKEAGAIRKLPPAASAQDAIDFLQKLGVFPKDGWEIDKEVDETFLKSFLPDGATGTLDELLQQVQDLVQSRFEDANVSQLANAAQASGGGS